MNKDNITDSNDLLNIILMLFVFPIFEYEWPKEVKDIVSKYITDTGTVDADNAEALLEEIRPYIEEYYDSMKEKFNINI